MTQLYKAFNQDDYTKIEELEKVKEFNERLVKTKSIDKYFYLQTIESSTGPRVVINGQEMIMLASYSYLGLIEHPKIKEAAIKAINKYGTGAGGVRLLAGTTDIHKELEAKIADFKGAEDSIVFSSGYVTNLATISSLYGSGDLVIMDKLDHASIVDGCFLSGAHFRTYKHNDMENLQKILKKSSAYKNIIIIADAVFSMDGDICNLPEIVNLAEKFGASIMIDEAHSVGVLGNNGTGIESHFGLGNVVDLKMGTLSKAIPSIGGYIAGRKEIIDFLKHNARAFVFSASLPPSNVASAIAAFEVMKEESWRFENLEENCRYMREGLQSIGFDTLKSETPILPVIIGSDDHTLDLTKFLFENKIFASPILYPAVSKNTSRIRTHLMATHTKEDIDYVIDIFKKAKERFDFLQ